MVSSWYLYYSMFKEVLVDGVFLLVQRLPKEYYELCTTLLLLSSPLLWQLRILLVWLVNDLLRPPLLVATLDEWTVKYWIEEVWGEVSDDYCIRMHKESLLKVNSNPLSNHVVPTLQTAMRSSQIGSNVVQHAGEKAGRRIQSLSSSSYWVRSSTYLTKYWLCLVW